MTRDNPYKPTTNRIIMTGSTSCVLSDGLWAVLFYIVLVGIYQAYVRIWSHMSIASVRLSVTLLLLFIATLVAGRIITSLLLGITALILFWATVFVDSVLFSDANEWSVLTLCMKGALVHTAVLAFVNTGKRATSAATTGFAWDFAFSLLHLIKIVALIVLLFAGCVGAESITGFFRVGDGRFFTSVIWSAALTPATLMAEIMARNRPFTHANKPIGYAVVIVWFAFVARWAFWQVAGFYQLEGSFLKLSPEKWIWSGVSWLMAVIIACLAVNHAWRMASSGLMRMTGSHEQNNAQ